MRSFFNRLEGAFHSCNFFCGGEVKRGLGIIIIKIIEGSGLLRKKNYKKSSPDLSAVFG